MEILRRFFFLLVFKKVLRDFCCFYGVALGICVMWGVYVHRREITGSKNNDLIDFYFFLAFARNVS